MDSELAVDACMDGAGGISQTHYFHVKFPQKFKEQELKITHLELWAVIVCCENVGTTIYRQDYKN